MYIKAKASSKGAAYAYLSPASQKHRSTFTTSPPSIKRNLQRCQDRSGPEGSVRMSFSCPLVWYRCYLCGLSVQERHWLSGGHRADCAIRNRRRLASWPSCAECDECGGALRRWNGQHRTPKFRRWKIAAAGGKGGGWLFCFLCDYAVVCSNVFPADRCPSYQECVYGD